jgi:hypothetical protein
MRSRVSLMFVPHSVNDGFDSELYTADFRPLILVAPQILILALAAIDRQDKSRHMLQVRIIHCRHRFFQHRFRAEGLVLRKVMDA